MRKAHSMLFGTMKAVIFAYDNFQRGLTLQHQRGKHSSAFFKGTHECAHEVTPYDDVTFDNFHPFFSQHDQDIPSPDGMPAFEIVNVGSPSAFFASYESFESCELPDFTGERVRAYIKLRTISEDAELLARSFPTTSGKDDVNEYFHQCPS